MAWTKEWGSTARRLVGVTVVALMLVLGSSGLTRAIGADHVIYSEGLASGWQNWSWSSYVNFSASGGSSGAQSIGWQINSGWAGLFLHTDSAVQTASGTSLQFALMGSRPGQQLQVYVTGDGNQAVGWARRLSDFGGDPVAWQWKYYDIPLSGLGAAGQRITGVIIQDANGWAQPTIQVDEVKLTAITSTTSGTSDCLWVPAYPEIRWVNWSQNMTRGRPTNAWAFWGNANWRGYYDRIDGACTGTTEQILEWAAKKWGFDQLGYPDLAKAVGVAETWWRVSFVGPYGELGILQLHPGFLPDTEPATWSTAYGADYAMAVIRSYYDGSNWIGAATKGDLRGSVAAWNCGCAYNGGGMYASTVFQYHSTKPWKRPGQPPEWF
jgi:hypothetical protein